MKRGTIVKSIVIGLALVGMLAFAGTARADFTSTFDFGPQDSGTTIQAGTDGFITWIAKGTLPAGSILTSVSVNARLDAQVDASDSYASDMLVYVDSEPSAPGTTGAILQVGGYGTISEDYVYRLYWANGGTGEVGATVIDAKSAAEWSELGDVDLNAAQLFIGNNYAAATWSGTVSVTYTPEPATMSLLVLGGLTLLRRRRRA